MLSTLANSPGAVPLLPHDFTNTPSFDELGDARVAAAVGDEDVALRVPGHVGRTVEEVLRRSGAGGRAAVAAAAVTAAARPPARGGFCIASALRPSSNATRPCGSNFITMPDISSTDPDVVLRIDAHLRGEQKPVDALADLARELARAIELEQPRAAVREWTRWCRCDIVGWPVRV